MLLPSADRFCVLESSGRLSRSSQPVTLLDGQQLGPVCRVQPLQPPRASGQADTADQARPQTAQASYVGACSKM